MTIVVTGKQMDVGDSLKQTIQNEIETVVGRHMDGTIDATVTLSKDPHHNFRTEMQIHVGRGLDVHSSGLDTDPHKSALQAIEKLEAQLRRYKTRLHAKRRRMDDHEQRAERVQKFVLKTQEEDTHDDNPLVIAETISEIHTLSVGDAVMKMDLALQPAMVFRNAANGEINVVFKRCDGHIGWIDPSLKLA